MRSSKAGKSAPKRTVSITLDADLYANAKSVGVNISKVAEEALEIAYADRRRALLAAQLQQDVAAAESYAQMHGAFSELVRAHYAQDGDAV